MRTNIEAVLTPIWLLALSILVTIYLAWGFYYFDVDWMHLLNYVVTGLSSCELSLAKCEEGDFWSLS